MQEEVSIECPFCGETVTILVDTSVSNQSYVEDCSVCCRPIQFDVSCEDGAVVQVNVDRD